MVIHAAAQNKTKETRRQVDQLALQKKVRRTKIRFRQNKARAEDIDAAEYKQNDKDGKHGLHIADPEGLLPLLAFALLFHTFLLHGNVTSQRLIFSPCPLNFLSYSVITLSARSSACRS